jgi:hypothetical protein
MTATPRISIIVPIEHSGANLPALLERLALAVGPEFEILLCRTSADRSADVALPPGLPVRWLACAPGSRIPEMWRDGIVAAGGELVALLTAHCLPTESWMEAVRRLRFAPDVAGIGGSFTNPPDAAALSWAIYLLRYAPFSRPVSSPAAGNIAADNAVYRRQDILACQDLLPRGFWELEYHRQFAARGLRLELSSDLVVIHENRYTGAQFASQRRAHGFEFGRDRARLLGTPRLLAYLAATPAIPLVLFGKVAARARRYRWLRELRPSVCGWLVFLCANWGLGEARGVLHEVRARVFS